MTNVRWGRVVRLPHPESLDVADMEEVEGAVYVHDAGARGCSLAGGELHNAP